MRNKVRKNNKIFTRFLVSVFPIFIVPVIVMIGIYFSSNSVTNNQTYERNLAVLQNSADTFQKTFVNVDNLISYLDRDPSISNFLSSYDPRKDISTTIDVLNTQDIIKSLTITNSIIKNIQLYSADDNVIIDSTTSGLYLERYYAYNYIKDVAFTDWQNKFLKPNKKSAIYTNVNVVNSGHLSRNIIYAKSLPLSEATMNFKGNVLIFLDEDYLLSQFGKIPYKNSGFIYILDGKGNTIIYDNKSSLENPFADSSKFVNGSGYFLQNIGNKDMFVTYYKEPNGNWTFVAALPKNQVLAPTENIRLYISLLILFTILSGLILVVSSVAKLSKPISHVFAMFADKNQNLSYNDFEYEISKLVENNEKLVENLNRQLPELRTSIFYNLFIGGYRDTDEIRNNLSKINIKLDSKYYVVLIATINELNMNAKLEEISAQKMYINNLIMQHFQNIEGIYNLDFQRTVLLLSFDFQNEDMVIKEMEDAVTDLLEALNSNIQMSISFAGDMTDSISKLQSCLLNAYAATSYKHKNVLSRIQWYIKTLQNDNLNFYYPIELETQIISLVFVGNTEKLSELLKNLDQQNKNIITREYSPVFYNLLLSMNSTLIRIINESGNFSKKLAQTREKITAKIEAKDDLQKIYYLLKDSFISVALLYKVEQGKSYSTQQSQILQYINEHYTDAQLSLTSVADVFHITEGYLSNLFKHISGENFSKYIEKLRLKRAHDLIEHGFKVHEVAFMAGYNSPQVFRRAYRRYYGVALTGEENVTDDNGKYGQ